MSASPEIRPASGEAELAEALQVRIRVFVHEQNGPLDEEPDAWDARARHWIVRDGGRTVGTARLYEPEPGVTKIGRVALLPEARGRGWGELLMRELLAVCAAEGRATVILDAQEYALGFYERLGFRAEGEPFLDAGIPHRRMRLQPVL